MNNLTASQTAYSYIRFSSGGQAKGDSVRRQTQEALKYAKKMGLTLADNDIYHDLSVSALKGKNRSEGALKTFLDAVKEGKIKPGSTLLVEALDRLSREKPRKVIHLLGEIVDAGITVVTLHDKKVWTSETLDDPMNLMMSVMLASRANEEVETKKKRILEAWENKRKQAIDGKGILCTQCPSWIYWHERENKFVLLPERAETVRLVFKMILDGIGNTRIIQTLNEKKVFAWGSARSKRLKGIEWRISQKEPVTEAEKKALQAGYAKSSWNEAIVQRFVKYPASYGGHQTKTLHLPDDYYPGVISKENWLKAKDARLKRRGVAGRAAVKMHNIFTHGQNGDRIFTCKICGGSMIYVNKGDRYKHLTCSTARSRKVQKETGKSCQYHTLRYHNIEKHILYSLREMDWSLFSENSSKRNFDGEILTKKEEQAQIQTEIDNLLKLVGSGDFTESMLPSLNKKVGKLERDKGLLSDEIEAIEAEKAVDAEKSKAFDIGMVDEFYGSEDHQNVEKRLKTNQILKSLIKTITVQPYHIMYDDWKSEGLEIWGQLDIRFHKSDLVRTILILDADQTKTVSIISSPSGVPGGGYADFDTMVELATEKLRNGYYIPTGEVLRYKVQYNGHIEFTEDAKVKAIDEDKKRRFTKDGLYTMIPDSRVRFLPPGAVGVAGGEPVFEVPDLPPAPSDARFDEDYDWENDEFGDV